MSRMLREVKSFEKRSMLMGGGPHVSVDKRVNGVSFTQLFENLLFALAGLEGEKMKTFQKLIYDQISF